LDLIRIQQTMINQQIQQPHGVTVPKRL